MQQVLNPLVSMYQSQLEASRRFADAIFSGTQKIDHIMIDATQQAFNEQINFAQAMTRDPRAADPSLRSNFLSAHSNDAANYQREIMNVVAEMQSEIGKSVHQYFEQLGIQAPDGTNRLRETVRQAADPAFNPVTSMFSAWESAFKEVASLAKKNMAAAQSTAHDTMSQRMQAAGNYADVTGGGAHAGSDTMDNAVGTAAQAARSAAAFSEGASEDKRGSSGNGKRK